MAYNLQGILTKSVINFESQFQRMAYISQNMANVNTNGYKSVRFEDIIDADGTVHGKERTDTKVGDFMLTNNALDIGLNVQGYIPVTTKEGEIRYTRDGSFTTDKDGYLMTKTGDMVGSGIIIDPNSEKIEIKENGDVYTYDKTINPPVYVGTIPVVQFKNPEAMKEVGSNNYVPTDDAGEMTLAQGDKLMKQYGIERSNADIINEVYNIARINASVLATSSLMKAVNSMYDSSINITDV